MSRCGFVTAPSVRGAAPTTRWCRPHARGSRISRRAARPAAPRRNLGANSIGQMGFAGSGLGCGWGSLCFSIFESAAEGTGFAGRVAGLSERGALFSAAGAVFRGNLASFPVAGCSPDEMGVPPFHAWTSMEGGGTSMGGVGWPPFHAWTSMKGGGTSMGDAGWPPFHAWTSMKGGGTSMGGAGWPPFHAWTSMEGGRTSMGGAGRPPFHAWTSMESGGTSMGGAGWPPFHAWTSMEGGRTSMDGVGRPPFHAWTSMESGGTSMQSAGKTPRGGRGLSFLAPALHGARSVCLMSMAAFGFCVLLLLRLHLWGCVGSLASCASSRSFFSSLLLLNRTRLRSCRSRFTKRGSSMTEMGLGSFSWGGRLRM